MKAGSAPDTRPSLKEALTALFADPHDKAFFFALHGVLLPAHRHEGPTEAPDAPIGLLDELHRISGGAVAVLSDRSLDEVDGVLAPLRMAGCGSNGLEIRHFCGGPAMKLRFAADLDPVRRLLTARRDLERRVDVTDDGLALTLGHGGEAVAMEAARIFAHDAVALAPAVYRAEFGAGSARVTFAGASLGSAVCRIMDGEIFAGRIPIVFGPAGRSTDFRAVARFFGGTTVAVGSVADTEADIRLDGPRDVHWIIRDLLAHFEVESRTDPRGNDQPTTPS